MTPPTPQEDLHMLSHTSGGCCGSSCTCTRCSCEGGTCRKPGRLIGAVTLRRSGTEDAVALRRLATLDSSPTPDGETLVAEHEGALVAAVTVDGRTAIADPFVPTADIVRLLRAWSAQFQVAA
jgi:hypothetical protein